MDNGESTLQDSVCDRCEWIHPPELTASLLAENNFGGVGRGLIRRKGTLLALVTCMSIGVPKFRLGGGGFMLLKGGFGARRGATGDACT